jgi:hypothetical protein
MRNVFKMRILTKDEIMRKVHDVHTETLNELVYEIAVYCIDSRVSIDDAIAVNFEILNADAAGNDRECIIEAVEYIFEMWRIFHN